MNTKIPAIEKVISGGFCIGCGACSAVDPAFKVQPAPNGELRVLAMPTTGRAALASSVCPFGDAPDEDELASQFIPEAVKYHDGVGRYREIWAGWSKKYRGVGGSGGLTRWLFAKLLDKDVVQFVVQVDRKSEGASADADLFYYAIHSSAGEYLACTSTSAYYPVSLSDLIGKIESLPGRCAITALPCFARAVRALSVQRPSFAAKVGFISGTVCGSLKSRRYAEYLAHQMGVAPADIGRINFRGKSLSRVANEKCVEVWSKKNTEGPPDGVARVQDLDGTNYGLGYFKYKGCDYCDDVLAETADVAFGDAWIDPYRHDPAGTNLVVVRNRQIGEIFAEGLRLGEIHLEGLSPEQAAQSQAGGLRHRRRGLAVRLKLADILGAWTPRKRVKAAWAPGIFLGIQVCRVATRRVTSSRHLGVTSPLMKLGARTVLLANRLLEALQRRLA